MADLTEFVEALCRVASSGSVLGPEVVRQLLAHGHQNDSLSRRTSREREVLARMAEGRSSAAIAEDLSVSLGAVEKHVANIFVKLDLPPDDSERHRRVMAVVHFLRG